MEERILSEVRPAHLMASPGVRSRVSTGGILSGLSFAIGVAWLTILLSGLLAYAADRGHLYYYAFVSVFAPLLIVSRMRDLPRLALVPETWLWLLGVMGPVMLYFAGQNDVFSDRVMKDRIVHFSLVMGSAALLLRSDARRLLQVSSWIVLAWAIPICFVELVVPNLFSTAQGRAAGLYVNPNMASAAILLCLVLAVDVARPTARTLVLVAVGVGAIFATFSRMGMVFSTGLALVVALAPRLGDRRAIGAGQRVLMLVLLAILAGGAIAWIASHVQLSGDAALRLRSFLTGDLSDESASGRIQRTLDGIEMVRQHLLGHGMGYVERAVVSPHNTYLYVAIDYGIPGLLVFLGILFLGFARAARAGWQRGATSATVAVLLAFTSLFDHYVANSMYLAVGFGALMTGALIRPREAPKRAAAAVRAVGP